MVISVKVLMYSTAILENDFLTILCDQIKQKVAGRKIVMILLRGHAATKGLNLDSIYNAEINLLDILP